MKKILILFSLLAVVSSLFFAQSDATEDDIFAQEKYELEKVKTSIIIPENQHCTDKNASVKIEYSPIYDEVRIYYETLYVTYDRGEAMNTVMAVLQDFQKENKYYSYKYLKPESHKHFRDDRGQRKVQWSAYLKFSR